MEAYQKGLAKKEEQERMIEGKQSTGLRREGRRRSS
jgi:hypothetical protein